MLETVEYSNDYYWVTSEYWFSLNHFKKATIKLKIRSFFNLNTPFIYGPVMLRDLGEVFYFKTDDMPHPERIETDEE